MSKYWGGISYDGKVDDDDPLPQTPIKIPKKRYAFKSVKLSKILNEAQRHFAVHRDYKFVRIQSYRVGEKSRLSRRSGRRTAQHSVSSI